MTNDRSLPVMPFERPNFLEPARLLGELQSVRPITRVRTPAGDPAWLVTGYQEVRELLPDERLGQAHADPEAAPRYTGSVLGAPTANLTTEKEDHARVRRILTRLLSARRMNGLRPSIQSLVDRLLDDLERQNPPADFHEAFSFPLPALVICELLGVPHEDRERFRRWTEQLADIRDVARARAGRQALDAYMRGLMRDRRGRPADDLLSELVAACDEDAELTEARAVGMASILIVAGHETTVASIDFGTALLAGDPAQAEPLRRDPSLLPHAVEEILRLATPGGGVIPRYANADIEIGGFTIRLGDLVLLETEAANRDPRVFDEPNRFDVARQPNPHLAFGHGAHFCVGAGLARVELQSVFGTLLRRFPTLRLAAPVERLRLRQNIFTGGLVELPVTW